MGIEQYRKQFSIFIVDADLNSSESRNIALLAVGYQTEVFSSPEAALFKAEEALPHLIIFDPNKFPDEDTDFLQKIKDLSDEIRVIVLVKNIQTGLQWVGQALAYDFCTLPLHSLLQLTQMVDRTVSALLDSFAKEQLLQEKHSLQQAQPLGSLQLAHSQEESNLLVFARALQEVTDLDSSLEIYLQFLSLRLNHSPALYFRYFSQHMTLSVLHCYGIALEKIRGIGLDLKEESEINRNELVKNPEKSKLIKQFLFEAFGLQDFTVQPHEQNGELLGLFVAFSKSESPDDKVYFAAMQMHFSAIYARNLLLKERHRWDHFDHATGLLNRKGMLQEIEKEMARARRILQPISLLAIRIEGFEETKAEATAQVVAAVLQKSARANDILARTGPEEFMLLLPHTPAAGGAKKAERARRAVETLRFPALASTGTQIRISVGVSEYPSHASDSESLIKTSDESLWQVHSSGGNKICLATPPSNFTADFTFSPSKADKDKS